MAEVVKDWLEQLIIPPTPALERVADPQMGSTWKHKIPADVNWCASFAHCLVL